MKLIQVTDTHFLSPGQDFKGLDPRARLDSVIRAINANHGDAHLCIFSGDLADEGEPEAYENLQECLAALRVPYRLMIGNHDDRGNFLRVFTDAPQDPNGFVQGALETPAGWVLTLDSVQAGGHAGFYCEQRLDWLDARLAAAGAAPVFLFIHHPPFSLEVPKLDELALLEPDPLGALLQRHGNVRHLFFGHVHRAVAGSWRGIPVSALRGTAQGGRLDFWGAAATYTTHRPPALGVILIQENQTLVHLREVDPLGERGELPG